MKLRLCSVPLFVFASLLAAPTLAHEAEAVYDRVSLSVSAEQEVGNDVLIAVLYAERSGGDQAALASEVNQAVGAALERARAVPAVSARTLGYNTWPQYANQVLRGWRVRQTLRLESRDAGALSNLLGDLQETLALGSLGYQVSSQAREAAQSGLIARALAAFRARAELVAHEMGRGGYRIVQIDIDTAGGVPRPMMMRGGAVALQAAEVAPPALEAGEQTLSVGVSGSIELLPGAGD